MGYRLKLFQLFLVLAVSIINFNTLAASNSGFVYSGRIVKANGMPVNEDTMDITVSVYSPAPASCLLYQEKFSNANMDGKQGTFSVTLGLPTPEGTRLDSTGFTFNQIVSNANFNFTGLTCAVGNSYTPSASDERVLNASFTVDSDIIVVENLQIKSVPYAMQANEVSGYGISNIARLSGVGSIQAFTTAAYEHVVSLFNGSNTTDLNLNSKKITNVTDPAAAQDAATKNYVDTAVAGLGAGTLTDVTVTAPMLVTTPSAGVRNVAIDYDNTTIGSISSKLAILDLGITNAKISATAAIARTKLANSGSANSVVVNSAGNVMTETTAPTVAGQFLKWDGDSWEPTAITKADVGTGTTNAGVYVNNLGALSTTAMTDGQILIGSGVGAPQPATISGTANQVSVTNGSNSITLSVPTNIAGRGLAAPGVGQDLQTARWNNGTPAWEWFTPQVRVAGSCAAGNSIRAIAADGTVTCEADDNAGGTVTSVTGTAPVVSSGGTTPAISMAAATSLVPGYLTAADWTTFNAKQNRVTGTCAAGSSVNAINADGTVTCEADDNSGGTVTSVTGTAPIVSSGGATPAISMAAATSLVPGYLTAADWTTFNNKQTRVAGTCAAGQSIRAIAADGTVTCEVDDNSGGTVTGSGTAGRIARFTAGTALGDSSISDDGTNATANGALSVTGEVYTSGWLRNNQSGEGWYNQVDGIGLNTAAGVINVYGTARIGNVQNPVNAQDVATKAYVDANAGGSLKVYKTDGTTVLGYYVGCMTGACDGRGIGWGYSDTTTGVVGILTSSNVYDYSPYTAYYTTTNCTGTMYAVSYWNTPTCNGNICYQTCGANYGGSVTYNSYNSGAGCVAGSANIVMNYYAGTQIAVPLCGAGAGCKIK